MVLEKKIIRGQIPMQVRGALPMQRHERPSSFPQPPQRPTHAVERLGGAHLLGEQAPQGAGAGKLLYGEEGGADRREGGVVEAAEAVEAREVAVGEGVGLWGRVGFGFGFWVRILGCRVWG